MSLTSSVTESASTVAVFEVLTPVFFLTLAAIASHLLTVRLAKVISPKVSTFMAHLKATTLPTPPAPMIRVLFLHKGFSLKIISVILSQIVVVYDITQYKKYGDKKQGTQQYE